ncbi:MAG: 4-(cytidine 5'-diphospho)-2-C-methyl-D-erythritol kinase [Pseudomonadota bacterium]
MTVREIAPAKVNLYLHVGPPRDDGLHDIASLFVFTDAGDVVEAAPADDITLAIDGEFADALADEPVEKNLVYRAALALREAAGVRAGAALTLTKNLPVAAGIGGGSADAAAALRALMRLWDVELEERALQALAFSLGADVPACLRGAPVLVDGAGEQLSPAPPLPPLHICIVNPRLAMPTGPVFQRFDALIAASGASQPPPAHPGAALVDLDDAPLFFAETRNDLEPAALAIDPRIGEVIDSLAGAPGAIAARMSGSGASAFALFSEAAPAQSAARAAQKKGWWSMASAVASR